MKPNDLQASLSDLAVLQARTDADERKILAAATQRLGTVNAMLRMVEPQARRGDPNGEAEYQALVLERGQLNIVIAKARDRLPE